MNKTIISGHLGRDPELSYTQSGTAVCKFSVAVTERWKDSTGNKQERTDWFNVTCWSGLAELCGKYLSKGKKVLIEGKMQFNKWTDKEGVERTLANLVAKDIEFLSPMDNQGGQQRQQQGSQGGQQRQRQGGNAPPAEDGPGFDPDSDDIPF